jgi:Tol biopolymer transport system component/DNA-binding winged helix-turn-helix (wHTH) protein
MRDKDGRQIRFGIFEVDLVAGELRKADRLVRLQEQPFRILKVLLERPGEVVTREELRKRIWGDDVYVDFDRSLNTSVARLREALGDSPTRPVYVETVPRKGYRFIASIDPQAPPQVPRETVPAPPEQAPSKHGLRLGMSLGGIVLAAVLAGFYWRSPTQRESPVPPSAPQRLTSYVGSEDEPTFSPDGSQFAFIWNGAQQDNFDVYVRTVSGGAPLRLTDHPNRDSSPAWSPDGQWIAFERRLDDETSAVFRVSPVGGREEKLLELPGRKGYLVGEKLAWSPDSAYLAIAAPKEGTVPTDFSLFLFHLSTGSQRTLIDFWGDVEPSFSPDGRFLAYGRFGIGCFVLALSDSLEPLGKPEKMELGESCQTPVWMPDGRRLVMEAGFRDSPPGLWSVRPDGSDAKSLNVPSLGFGSSLRPAAGRGGRLAFQQDLKRSTIWRLDLESGKAGPLIASSGVNLDPVYSPDGRRILFWSDRGPTGVWVANADGSEPTLLVEGAADARWSPDGSRVAFRALEPGNSINFGPHDIWVIDSEGGPSQNLSNSPSWELVPAWSRDGKWIYFVSYRNGARRLWKMPADRGEPTLVLDGPFVAGYESDDGQWLYLLSARTVFRALANGEPEVLINEISGWSSYGLAADGLYYSVVFQDGGSEIRFYRFEDGSSTVIYRMSGKASEGLDLSPDGRYLVFTQIESEQSDLMLLEGIH